MKVQDLVIPALIGLPAVGAYCLAFIVASVINGGRSWPLWLLLLVVCCVLWGLAYSDTQRTMSVVEPSWEAYGVWEDLPAASFQTTGTTLFYSEPH